MRVETHINDMMAFREDPIGITISRKLSDDLEKVVESMAEIHGATVIKFNTSLCNNEVNQLTTDLGIPCFSARINLCDENGKELPIPSIEENQIVLHVYRKPDAVGVARYLGSTENYKFASWDNLFPSLVNEIVFDLTREQII